MKGNESHGCPVVSAGPDGFLGGVRVCRLHTRPLDLLMSPFCPGSNCALVSLGAGIIMDEAVSEFLDQVMGLPGVV